MEDKSKAMVVVEATPKYHLLPTAEVMAAVGGKEATATPAAIEEQRRRFGSNALAEPQVSALEQGVVSCALTFSLAHQLCLTHPRSHVVAILIQPLCACKHSLSTFALALARARVRSLLDVVDEHPQQWTAPTNHPHTRSHTSTLIHSCVDAHDHHLHHLHLHLHHFVATTTSVDYSPLLCNVYAR